MSKETFDFSEALKRMKRGKKVRRESWDDGEHCYLDDGFIFYDACYHSYRYNEYQNFFSLEDVEAIDWEEVKE